MKGTDFHFVPDGTFAWNQKHIHYGGGGEVLKPSRATSSICSQLANMFRTRIYCCKIIYLKGFTALTEI
jgi:hypothetical protein